MAEPSGVVAYSEVVTTAFGEIHDGWSTDEVLLNDKLNTRFIAACQKRLPSATAKELNWKLLSLRKAGKLNVPLDAFDRSDGTRQIYIRE